MAEVKSEGPFILLIYPLLASVLVVLDLVEADYWGAILSLTPLFFVTALLAARFIEHRARGEWKKWCYLAYNLALFFLGFACLVNIFKLGDGHFILRVLFLTNSYPIYKFIRKEMKALKLDL